MIGLIKNEFIKEYTLKRIIFILLFFVIITIGFILFRSGSTSIEGMSENDALDLYKNQLVVSQKAYDKNKTLDNLHNLMGNKIFVEYYQSLVDEHIPYGDWRSDLVGNIMLLKLKMTPLAIIKGGAAPDSFEAGKNYKDYSVEQIDKEIEDYQGQIEQLNEALKSNKYYVYVGVKINSLNDELDGLNNQIKQGVTDYNISQALRTKEEIKISNFVVSHKITTNKDKRVKESEAILSAIVSKQEVLSEVDFKKDFFKATQYKDYKQYKEMVTAYNKGIDNEIKMSWYAMENNFFHAGSPFLNVIDESYVIFIFITFLMIMRASSTLTSEFNSGTIKLLLTKGASRLKIVTAKIINVLLSSYLMAFAFLLTFIIIGSFFFDISDLLSPKLEVINNVVIQKSYVLWLIKNILIVTVPMVFLCGLSFLIAIITLNGIIASGTSIFILLLGIEMMGFIVGSYMFFLKYTPFAYLNMTSYTSSHIASNNYHFMPSIFSLNQGVIILLLSTLIVYGISIIIFMRRDIKN